MRERVEVRIPVVLCLWLCAFVLCSSFCRAETIVVGGDFTNRIPAEGSGNASMADVMLFVPEHKVITDLDVYLDITHTNVIDLLIYLRSPTGLTIELKDDEMMNSFWQEDPKSNLYDTVFDDEALLTLPQGEPPYTGRFRPVENQYLSIYNGHDVFGDWTLEIFDMAYADVGSLDRWELRFEVINIPEPATFVYLSLLFAYRILGRIPRRNRSSIRTAKV